MAQAVVERFGLMQRGEPRSLEDVIKEMQATTTAAIREGVVAVKVEDTDPHLAAAIANFQVEHLDRLISQFGTGDASRQRRFLTEQLARAKGQLDLGEEELRRFKVRNRAIVLEAQTQGAIEAAARLKGEIMATEVQLQVMRNFATEANPEVITLRRRIEEMRRQLGDVQYGEDGAQRPSGRGPGRGRREIYVPFSRVPELGIELARLTREVKVQETLVTLISQQVEQTKIMESQDLPTIRVLDKATVPERPAKPSIRINLAIAGVASLLVGIVLAFVFDFIRGLPAFAVRRT